MYYTPPIFVSPKANCAVRIEEMIESPKKDAAPCVALIEDVVKTKVDQMPTNEMKPLKKKDGCVNAEKMVADEKKQELMVEPMSIAVVAPKHVKRGMYQMPPQFFANMKKEKVESKPLVEVFKLEVDTEQERELVKKSMSTEDLQLEIGPRFSWADEPMDDASHVEDKYIDEDMAKDVKVAELELMLEEEPVAGDGMMKMEDLPPSDEPSTLQVLEEKESMEDHGDCFVLDSDEEEGWFEMATLLHLDVHVNDTKGVGNMSPNDFLLQEDSHERKAVVEEHD